MMKYYHKLIFCTDYGYIEAVEKKFKDLLSKEKENIKPCEENVLVSGMKFSVMLIFI